MLAKLTITSLPLHKHLHLTIVHMIIMQVNTKSQDLQFSSFPKRFFSASLARIRIFSSPRFYFSASHSNSPIVGASDIGQESAYTCKLQELPTGTSQRSSSLCNSKGSTQITRYLFLRNNIQNMFSSQKTSEKHPIQVQGVPQQ